MLAVLQEARQARKIHNYEKGFLGYALIPQ